MIVITLEAAPAAQGGSNAGETIHDALKGDALWFAEKGDRLYKYI
jgi:hypothetical protein